MKRRHSGFTLLEALLTLGLVGLILGRAGGLLVEYWRLSQHAERKSTQASAVQVAMNLMLQDVRTSLTLVSPPAAPQYPMTAELRFWRVADPDWSATPQNWLPTPVPTTQPTPAWAPHDPAHLQEICYHKDSQGILWRDRGPTGFATTPQEQVLLAESVDGFAVRKTGREIQIQLSLRNTTNVKVVTGAVGIPQW